MTNKKIIFYINVALEEKEKGFNKMAKETFKKATEGINAGKFNRHTKQGKMIIEYWNEALDKIV
jgi:hypothetical protein